MKRIIERIIGAVALTAIISWVSIRSQNATPLRMTMRLNQRIFLLHEPLTAVVTLENGGSELIRIPIEIDSLGERYVTFDIVNDKNERIGYASPEESSSEFYSPDYRGIPLEPGEKYSVWYDLTWQEAGDRAELVLNRPGTYRVTARYQWRPDQPEIISRISGSAAPVEARVVYPTGKDREAHDLLSKASKPYLWNLSDAQTRNYARLIRQWPESGYAKYARCFLAQAVDFQARKNGFDRKSVDQAVRTWLAASNIEPPCAYSYFNQQSAALLLFEVKRYGESAALWRKMLQDRWCPDSQRRVARDMLKKMNVKRK